MYNNNVNNNRINQNMNFAQNGNNDPFKTMKKLYLDFCKNMKTNDLANSPQRYITEYHLINNLIKMAQEKNLTEECESLNSKLNETIQKLKEFGVEIK